MKLFKILTNAIRNVLSILDNLTEGSNQLAMMYREVTTATRQEHQIESINDLTQLKIKTGLSDDEFEKIRN